MGKFNNFHIEKGIISITPTIIGYAYKLDGTPSVPKFNTSKRFFELNDGSNLYNYKGEVHSIIKNKNSMYTMDGDCKKWIYDFVAPNVIVDCNFITRKKTSNTSSKIPKNKSIMKKKPKK